MLTLETWGTNGFGTEISWRYIYIYTYTKQCDKTCASKPYRSKGADCHFAASYFLVGNSHHVVGACQEQALLPCKWPTSLIWCLLPAIKHSKPWVPILPVVAKDVTSSKVNDFKSLLKCFRTGDLTDNLRKIEGSCETGIWGEDSFQENLNIMLWNAQFRQIL